MFVLMLGTSACCDYSRDIYIGYIDIYFKALVDNNPSAVPLAKNVKITMNGDVKSIAQTFW
jgi:hypothetical protein